MIIRKNAKTLTTSEKTAFTRAVLALKKQSSRLHPDNTSRSRYDDYVEVHLNAMMAMMIGHVPNWGHLSSAFGPWHRVLLFHLESELRTVESSVALPYWDWTDAASTSSVFSADFLGSNGRIEDGRVTDGPFSFDAGNWNIVVKDDDSNPEYLVRQFGGDPSAPLLPDKARDQDPIMLLDIYDEAPWYDNQRRTPSQRGRVDQLFRFRLEYDLHNLVHRYIGGHMALAASPNDPVFWLHHCNLDRLWSLWEQTMAGRATPYEPQHNGPDGQSGDRPLIFHFANSMPPWVGDTNPADVYESRAQLDVGYETDLPMSHLGTELRAAIPHKMTMPAKAMYPLRHEFHRAGPPHAMFPLRAEFKMEA